MQTHIPVPLIIALGIPCVAFDWGGGGCAAEATSVVPICMGFRRYLIHFIQPVTVIYLFRREGSSKTTRTESIFKPIVTLNWNLLNISRFKIWCRNVSAPSARWHHVYKYWAPELGSLLLHRGAYSYHFWVHKMHHYALNYLFTLKTGSWTPPKVVETKGLGCMNFCIQVYAKK